MAWQLAPDTVQHEIDGVTYTFRGYVTEAERKTLVGIIASGKGPDGNPTEDAGLAYMYALVRLTLLEAKGVPTPEGPKDFSPVEPDIIDRHPLDVVAKLAEFAGERVVRLSEAERGN